MLLNLHFFLVLEELNVIVFFGPACTNVPTIGSGSPCGYHTTTPSYAQSFIATQTQVINYHLPVYDSVGHASRILYVDVSLGKERIDTYSSTTNYEGPATNSSTQEYFIKSGSQINHYTFDVTTSTCTSEVLTGSLPNTGVPNGYQLLSSTSSTNTYYLMTGGRVPEEFYGTLNEITVSKSHPIVPISEYYDNHQFRIDTQYNTTWTSFSAGNPNAAVFTLPAAC